MSKRVRIEESEFRTFVKKEVEKVLREFEKLDDYPRYVQDAAITLDAEIKNIEHDREGYCITISAREFDEDKMKKLGRRGIRARDVELDGDLVHITISD